MPAGVPLRHHREAARAPDIHTTRGSLVHRALELAYARPAGRAHARRLPRRRSPWPATSSASLPDVVDLGLDDEQLATLDDECRELVERYLTMEDPTPVRAIGLELRLAADVGALELRGIIDRLDLRDDGELVVVDYKTGPGAVARTGSSAAWPACTSTRSCASRCSAGARRRSA